MYRTIVVDNEAAFREITRRLLHTWGDFPVVGEAASGEEAVKLVEKVAVDLVLLDIYLPGMSGLEAAKEILKRHPQVKVVLLSLYHEEEYYRLAKEVGAAAFLPKSDLTLSSLKRILGI